MYGSVIEAVSLEKELQQGGIALGSGFDQINKLRTADKRKLCYFKQLILIEFADLDYSNAVMLRVLLTISACLKRGNPIEDLGQTSAQFNSGRRHRRSGPHFFNHADPILQRRQLIFNILAGRVVNTHAILELRRRVRDKDLRLCHHQRVHE